MNSKPNFEIVPEEHLRAALRHAPDADLAAPHDISAHIRAAAWRALAHAAPRPLSRWRRGLGWFDTPGRLGASGAFATVLIAGVLGLIWQQGQPGAARSPEAVADAATRHAPVLAAAPVVANVVANAVAPEQATATLAATRVPARSASNAQLDKAAALKPNVSVVPDSERQASTQAPPQGFASARPTLERMQAAPLPAAAQLASAGASAGASADASGVASGVASAEPSADASAIAPPTAPALRTDSAPQRRLRESTDSRWSQSASAPVALPLSTWQQALLAPGSALQWRDSDGVAHPLSGQTLQLLASLPRAPWRPERPERPGTNTDSSGFAPAATPAAVVLERDGAEVARLWLEGALLRVCLPPSPAGAEAAAPRCLQAPLSAEQAQQLRWMGGP